MATEKDSTRPPTAEQNEEPKQDSKMSRLQIMLIALAAFALIGNAMVSASHAFGPDTGHNLAIHGAMDEFKKGIPRKLEKKRQKDGNKELPGSASDKKMDKAQDKLVTKRELPKSENRMDTAVAKSDSTTKKKQEDTPKQSKGIQNKNLPQSKIASLNCDSYGGPSNDFANEMVYWDDIHSDAQYVSPFRKKLGSRRQYMTFEPDGGGWNNIRMAMETVVGLAIATGRILVLPPQKKMYLLGKGDNKQKRHFDFDDFFPMKQMAEENAALDMITMKEFLETEAMTGNLRDKETGKPSFPPGNRTDWNGINQADYDVLREWLRTVAMVPLWRPGQCLATFPAQGNHKSIQELQEMQGTIHKEGLKWESYVGHPVPVDAAPIERMKENMAERKELCVYNETMQDEMVLHFACYHKMHLRLLVHFYCFLFMEDWREDLWMKRFMRDHMRYNDEIQCAAARVLRAMREVARKNDPKGNSDGLFDSFHVRRGDFQYKATRIPAEEIYKNSHEQLTPNTTIFIATDERDKKFFDPLRKHYNIYFLDDFKEALQGVNSNYFGMIDQLVAAKGRIFFGTWFSTFTGFIDRIRGYRSVKDKLPGYQDGTLPTSYYYAVPKKKFEMHEYAPLHGAFFNREFPTSWRDIDKGIGELTTAAV
ncbi:GDP-fucose protein O-fucosyltransferase [Seminavis robusta]|uniref:GDP-fucose protein O-fucosyltransferase n=1 Tax=Seminavis robusta TaxID=568900 RepID=A0A9N8EUK3_9STRA|nr:GDP-fucose protein O-fucosyltransferase [Seminavis robusta]|eukprot:Sro1726_g293810.1 GDP-fucose protein O-fucosyltransferase (650) ;mRNA; f:5741-7796